MFDEDRYEHTATEAEAHAEWHINSGVPMGQPCPWDACDPDPGPDEWTDADSPAPVYVPLPAPIDNDDIPF